MPKTYDRNCDNCGKHYVGNGKRYCSLACAGESNTRQTRKLDVNAPILRMSFIEMIRGNGAMLSEITDKLCIGNTLAVNLISSLEDSGYIIDRQGNFVKLMGGIPVYKPFKIDPKRLWGKTREFGVVSDSHLGSYNERLDVLECAYDDFKKRGITTVYHAGNVVEGECRFNKYDIRVHGIADQTLYAIDHYPQRTGITTYYITADDHEGWWFQREGIDFGRYMYLEAEKRGRKDLVHLGYQEVDIELCAKHGSSIMRLMHPGGGTAYAISYALQKIVESLQGGEKPQVVLCGHYHKAGVFYPREVHSVLCACTSDQSRFMRKRKIQAHVGYYVIRLAQADDGSITEFTTSWKPFYDRGYYIKGKL